MIRASVCTIGDEILIGQIVDTNSSAIARALGAVGIPVARMLSIGDRREEIIGTLSKELADNDIVIVTGGLGPTRDDVTKSALAELTGSQGYVEHAGQLEMVHSILRSRGLDVLDCNKAQAMVPDNCEVILNRRGTAPIMIFRTESGGRHSTLYSMPGVPYETLAALPEVVADICRHHGLNAICHRNVMTYGYAESALALKIADWEYALPDDIHLAYLPNTLTGVKLRLSIYEGEAGDEARRLDNEVGKLQEILGDAIYSLEEDSLQHALGKCLKSQGKSLSTAESCTGGEIAHLITTVPGSSDYYLGSVISYAIALKESLLGVSGETIRCCGVVSSEVAAEMAEGARRMTGSDYAVSTTGLAGPGGDERNPEGTVWVGVATPLSTYTKKYQYKNDRERNIERFSASALHFLLSTIRKELNC